VLEALGEAGGSCSVHRPVHGKSYIKIARKSQSSTTLW
jgi:hypothetical protein